MFLESEPSLSITRSSADDADAKSKSNHFPSPATISKLNDISKSFLRIIKKICLTLPSPILACLARSQDALSIGVGGEGGGESWGEKPR